MPMRAAQQAIDKAIEASKAICLVGNKYQFSLDVAGKLTITKILPGGEVKATVDAANATGGVLFQREEIRQVVDADIRKCMSEQWPRVLSALEGKSSALPSHDERTELKQAFVRELVVPVIYEVSSSKRWGDQWIAEQKKTVFREASVGGDPCQIEVKETTTSTEYEPLEPPKSDKGLRLVIPPKELASKLPNFPITQEETRLNVSEITTIGLDNWSVGLEEIVFKFGAIPKKLRAVASDDPLFAIELSTGPPPQDSQPSDGAALSSSSGRKRISQLISSTDRGSAAFGPKELTLTDSVAFVVADRASATTMADNLRRLALSCGRSSVSVVDTMDRVADIRGPPGELFQALMDAVFSKRGDLIGERTYSIKINIDRPKARPSRKK